MSKAASCAVLVLASVLSAQGIQWRASWKDALAEATEKKLPIFVAINMDGERANDRLIKEHYVDPDIVKLSAEFVCVAASKTHHTEEEGVPCPRFGVCTCTQHVWTEQKLRELFFPDNVVNAPQHLFVKADGTIHKSKVFFLTRKELSDLMLDVLKDLRPERWAELTGRPKAESPEAEAPPTNGGEPPPTEDGDRPKTLDELEAEMLAATEVEVARAAARSIAVSKDETAWPRLVRVFEDRKVDDKILEGVILGVGIEGAAKERIQALIPFLKDKRPDVRIHAAVALESIGDKAALKAIKQRLDAEKETEVEVALVRALGSCGRGDKTVSAALIKLLRSPSRLVQRNAAVALSWFEGDKKAVEALLELALAGGGGGRGGGGGFGGRFQVAEAAGYALVAIDREAAQKHVDERLEKEKNEFTKELVQGFRDGLDRDFDRDSAETVRWRRRAAGDKVRRDRDPEEAFAGNDDGGFGGGRPGRGGREGGAPPGAPGEGGTPPGAPGDGGR